MVRSRATDTARLVAAAGTVFREKGYRNATIDDIAAAAGISRPTVYKYSDSKRHLLDLMVSEVRSELSNRLRESLESDEPPMERLRRYVEASIEALRANYVFYAIVFSEEVELSDEGRVAFRAWARAITHDFRELISVCIKEINPESSLDPALTANLLLSMISSIYRWYDLSGRATDQELADHVFALISGALGRPAQP